MHERRRWVDREWLMLTGLAAMAVTVLDAVLLQVRRSYFTGGFLSVDHASFWVHRLSFAVGSLATDAVIAGLGVAIAMALAGRLRLGWAARWFVSLSLGAGPLLLASIVQYQVFAHLGDAFDFFLMFDLVGGRPSEILAVASGHLLAPALILLMATGAIGVTAWLLTRRFPGGVRAVRVATLMVGWLVVVAAGTTAMTALRLSSEVLDNGLRRKPSGNLVGTIVGTVSDVDRDGYGLLSRPADPDPFDPRVYPYALDIPGNGLDENGVAGDLPLGPSYTEASGEAPSFIRTPHIVIVMLETFRADLVGATVGGRDVTPVLNALAAEGVSARLAYSHNGYTVQSRQHFFTGSLAGLRGGATLIDDFQRNGYEVAYFSGQDESFGGARYDVGTSRADVFYDARQDTDRRYTTFATPGSLGVPAGVVLERVQAFLDARAADRPLMLYVSLYDTHYPYRHRQMTERIESPTLPESAIVPARADEVRVMYRNAAAHVDAAVGQLLTAAEAHLGAPPAVLVLADHGESLFDEGFLGHGYAINDVQMQIPLVARGLPLELCEPVGQVDLRDALWDALARTDAGANPTPRPCEGKRVFQYLGTIDRPRQIAFTGTAGRIVHDLRQDRMRFDRGPWRRPTDLDGADREAWLELVHYWERLQLAQAAQEVGTGGG